MATTQRDYYEVLGVARAADEAEIKRAFRRLARDVHPDVSQAPDAEERFREVVEAYEVLSKRETRELYDRYGHAGLRGGGYRPTQFDFGSLSDLFSAFFGDDLFGVGARPRRSRGGDVAVHVQITLAEAASGGGARAGDVYVEVGIAPDPRFVRDGNDVFSTVDLTITEAALGATVTVPTLDGDVELEFEPGTQPGEIRVLRGRGMPVLQGFGRGDHRVLVNVAVPRRLSDEQRALLEEFDRRATEENYRENEGFFEKLKSVFR